MATITTYISSGRSAKKNQINKATNVPAVPGAFGANPLPMPNAKNKIGDLRRSDGLGRLLKVFISRFF
jgi:hypothetical protein